MVVILADICSELNACGLFEWYCQMDESVNSMMSSQEVVFER